MATVDVAGIERKAELLTRLIAWSDLGPLFPVWGILEDTGVCQCPDGHECVNPGKHPIGLLVPNGWKDATTDGSTLHGWASSEFGAECNWALVCGHERDGYRLIGIDVDPRNDGDATLRKLETEHGHLPDTLCVNTGGGGQHYFVWAPADAKLRYKGGDGIEIKRHGAGYVVLEGSRHVSGRVYAIDVGCLGAGARSGRDLLAAVAKMPDAWLGALSGEDEHRAEIVPLGPATQTPLARGFEIAGWLGKSFGTGRIVPARCPWVHEHTPLKNGHRTGDGMDTSCVLLPALPKNPMGGFKCYHAHCSHRGVSMAWDALPEQAKARVREEFPEAFSRKKKKKPEPEPEPEAPMAIVVVPPPPVPAGAPSWPADVRATLDAKLAETQAAAANGDGRAQRILDRGSKRQETPLALHAGWRPNTGAQVRALSDDELACLALHVRWTEKTLLKTVSNLANYLVWDPRFWSNGRPCIFKNTRSHEVCFENPPWERNRNGAGWRSPDNFDAALLVSYLEWNHNMTVSHEAANQIIQTASSLHAFDPLAENMKRLGASWDGVPRLDKLIGLEGSGTLIECDKGDPEYLRLAGRYWMISLAKRCIEPGAQADSMLMLTGSYGIGKTSFFRALGDVLKEASGRIDSGIFVNIHLDNKQDEIEARIADAALVLIDELSGVNKQTVNAFKSMITATEATFRRTYARHSEHVKRSAVFCGTGNSEAVGYDKETLRRMWPVNVSMPIRRARVDAEVRLLLAEAVVAAMNGEVYWPNTQAMHDLFYAKRRGFIAMDEGPAEHIQNAIRDIVGEGMAGDSIPKVSRVLGDHIFVNFDGLCDYVKNRSGMLFSVHKQHVAASLTRHGFTRRRIRADGDVNGRVWGRPLDAGTLPGRASEAGRDVRDHSAGPEDGGASGA